jgi:hypothetical protein
MVETTPTFHDGYLTGVNVGEGFAILSLKRENGEAWEIRLAGVEALQMDDFRQGNIVFSVELTRGNAPEPAPFERLFGRPHPSAAAKIHEAYGQVILRKMAMVEEGKATLLVLASAYGADLVALCHSVQCEPIRTNGN